MRKLCLQLAVLAVCAPGLQGQVRRPDKPINLDFGNDRLSMQGLPDGWLLGGSAAEKYRVDLAKDVGYEGATAAILGLRDDAILYSDDFGTLMQVFKAKNFRGKRIRLSGHIKTKGAFGVVAEDGGAGLWLRVDGKDEMLALDNMDDRRIIGTADWTLCEIVLDVPEESEAIALGLMLTGYGRAWLAGLSMDEVGPEVPPTLKPSIARFIRPVIDEHGVNAGIEHYWELRESAPEDYDFGEWALNDLGYHYLERGKTEVAIAIFQLNVEVYPDDENAYDSLGEGYMEAGQRELAIQNYRQSLELNPGNDNARQMLQRMGADVEDEGEGAGE